ncbi:NmrA/HSCARG family protein [Marinobacter sp. NFXS9]|uniref:NmrA/HSCARG family protein n=1 Tax=Marinobacter sp. NFXS9 TaxID=2818433 RepID=UPI0032DEA005
MMNRKHTIAVLGASGQQGRGVVDALKAAGNFQVRAVTRNPDQYQGRADDVIYGDLDRPESLDKALRGAYGVFAVTNAWQPGTDEIAQCRALITSAKKQGVEHFVWSTLPNVEAVSEGRLDVPHFTNKAKMDREVADAGFRFYSFVMPAFYYQNFVYNMAPQPQQDGTLGWTLPINPAVGIDMADIGELGNLVAAAFSQPEKAGQGQHLPHVGSRISFNEIINGFKAKGIELTFTQIPAGPFAEAVPGGRELTQMFDWFEAHGYYGGDYSQGQALAEQIVSQAPTGFFQWAENNLKLEGRNGSVA